MRQQYMLLAFNTENRSDIRFCDYTTSIAKVLAWERIPKIRFTDSGHGIVFTAIMLSPNKRSIQPCNELKMRWDSRAKSWYRPTHKD
jgi:hypothetical protein